MKSIRIIILIGLVVMQASAAKPTPPLTVSQIAQEAYVKASNTRGQSPGRVFGDQFGRSVAISGDTVVVGAPYESSSATGINGNQRDTSAEEAGAAYVFVRSANGWTQEAYLKASNTRAGANFGISVAISGDTVVVGSMYESSDAVGINGNGNNGNSSQSGAAYVFVRSGTNWAQQAYLKASNADAHDRFGNAVAISGNTIVVGALYEGSRAAGVNVDQTDNSAFGAGAAYVFVRSGSVWSQEAYLKASNPDPLDFFGWSVAVSGDIIAVSAPWEFGGGRGINLADQNDNSADNAGAAYFFARHDHTWVQEAYVKASNAEVGDAFGVSLAASGDTVVVGAVWEDSSAKIINATNQDDNTAPDSGAAYVFVRNAGRWSEQAYLKPSNTQADDRFGASVTIYGDTAVVGAPLEDSGAKGVNGNQNDNSIPNSGAAYVFVRNGTSWSQQSYLKASNPGGASPGPDLDGDSFGNAVAISGDTVVVGAFHEASSATGINGNQLDDSMSAAGAAYVFSGAGRTLNQICPCNASWKNHGDYMQCVLNTTAALVNAGLLTAIEQQQLVQQAGGSDCGKKR